MAPSSGLTSVGAGGSVSIGGVVVPLSPVSLEVVVDEVGAVVLVVEVVGDVVVEDVVVEEEDEEVSTIGGSRTQAVAIRAKTRARGLGSRVTVGASHLGPGCATGAGGRGGPDRRARPRCGRREDNGCPGGSPVSRSSGAEIRGDVNARTGLADGAWKF